MFCVVSSRFASALVHAWFLGVFSVGVTLHSYSTRHLGLEGLGVHLGLDQIASGDEIFIWLPFTPPLVAFSVPQLVLEFG